MAIPVVDIFAGPGGLGEGFSAYRRGGSAKPRFKIAVSAEMETNAARTLRLRAFLRQFADGDVPEAYYDYVRGKAPAPWTDLTRWQWERAGREAMQLQLGKPSDDAQLYSAIEAIAATGGPWVLIGGPPCQAYSLVGRARNSGKAGYRAEDDHRHFLYEHYLHIISRYRPTAFIMENVKGILSSSVGGTKIFPKILDDLTYPGGSQGPRYNIVPLVDNGDLLLSKNYDHKDYIVRAEHLGIPQTRHRVILFGIIEGALSKSHAIYPSFDKLAIVRDVIGRLPKVRSGLTDADPPNWPQFAASIFRETAQLVAHQHPHVAEYLRDCAKEVGSHRDPGRGGNVVDRTSKELHMPPYLREWFIDPRMDVHLNHETRGHMAADLRRYAFVAGFAAVNRYSPRGFNEIPLGLAPKHENWESGKFLDRFKVQAWDNPSSTITSHLAKDGHYFIHPDAKQLRSLTVREAARLQTFPDNYFFEGSRGAQYRQVGNAVPPLMARSIAEVVDRSISA